VCVCVCVVIHKTDTGETGFGDAFFAGRAQSHIALLPTTHTAAAVNYSSSSIGHTNKVTSQHAPIVGKLNASPFMGTKSWYVISQFSLLPTHIVIFNTIRYSVPSLPKIQRRQVIMNVLHRRWDVKSVPVKKQCSAAANVTSLVISRLRHLVSRALEKSLQKSRSES